MPYLEIRSYRLNSDNRATFDTLMREQALPLVRAAGMDVVRYGPSEDSTDGYFLMRAWDSPQAHAAGTDAFYGGAAWRDGPREAILALLASFEEILVPVSAEAVAALRG